VRLKSRIRKKTGILRKMQQIFLESTPQLALKMYKTLLSPEDFDFCKSKFFYVKLASNCTVIFVNKLFLSIWSHLFNFYIFCKMLSRGFYGIVLTYKSIWNIYSLTFHILADSKYNTCIRSRYQDNLFLFQALIYVYQRAV